MTAKNADNAPLYKISIMLTRYGDPFSKFVRLVSGSEFTHASISLSPDEDIYYSFNLKGFIEEHWKNKKSKYLLPGKAEMHFFITEEKYKKLQQEIERFQKRKHELSYSAFGTLLCLAKIPHRFRKKYFCSQFIAEVLKNSDALPVRRKVSLTLPIHFLKELIPHLPVKYTD